MLSSEQSKDIQRDEIEIASAMVQRSDGKVLAAILRFVVKGLQVELDRILTDVWQMARANDTSQVTLQQKLQYKPPRVNTIVNGYLFECYGWITLTGYVG